MDGSIYEFDRLPRSSDAGEERVAPARTPARRLRAEPLVGVIRNPRSHRNKGVMHEMAERPNVITETPRTRPELARVLADFAARGVDLLAVDGGDGTVRDVLTCGAPIFGEHWPEIIVLPKGKTNALAVDLGLPGEWSLSAALDAARNGSRVARQPIVVDQPDRDSGQVLGFILGAGIFTTATQAGQTAHRYGAFNSFAVALTAIFGILSVVFGLGKGPWRSLTAMSVHADGKEIPKSRRGKDGHRYAIVWSTLETFPLGMKLFGKVRGTLRYGALDAPLRRVALLVPFLFAGLDKPAFARLGIHRGTAKEAQVEFDDRFILDGEAFPAGSYRLRAGPTLQFVAP